MTLAKLKVSPFGPHDKLTSTEIEILNEEIPFAIDGRHGGTYAPDADITFTSVSGLTFTGASHIIFNAAAILAIHGTSVLEVGATSQLVGVTGAIITWNGTATFNNGVIFNGSANFNGPFTVAGASAQFATNTSFTGGATYTFQPGTTLTIGSAMTVTGTATLSGGLTVSAGATNLNTTTNIAGFLNLTSITQIVGASRFRWRVATGSLTTGVTGDLNADVTIGPSGVGISADFYQPGTLTGDRTWTVANGADGEAFTVSLLGASNLFQVILRRADTSLLTILRTTTPGFSPHATFLNVAGVWRVFSVGAFGGP